MKYYILIMSTLVLSACVKTDVEKLNSLTPSASTICSGTTILNVAGTADCSGSGGSSPNTGPIAMQSFASRKDNSTFPVTAGEFTAFFLAPDRIVASLKDEQEGNATFTGNHSVVPNPFNDSDGRYQMTDYNGDPIAASTEKKHYLETIARNDPDIFSRAGIRACGANGTIEARIDDCASENGLWAFYDGKKYGQDGEGDWKLVSVVGTGPKFEVWRDERTKLLWSDKSTSNYNWYQAAGYSKLNAVSLAESEFLSSPGTTDPKLGSIMQPASPISVCPDVNLSGAIAAGGGTAGYTYVNPETNFKAGLSHPETTWRLPSRSDWGLAEVNGIRKVLPNMDDGFWSSSTYSYYRSNAWFFGSASGNVFDDFRNVTLPVRCVASSRD